MEMNSKFDHKAVENGKYKKWLEDDVFYADPNSDKIPYSIVLPPPNVTGKLHLGHAWDGTLQDILIRFKKMQGFESVWLPGMDHAGIATQAKVDEKLREMGINSSQIGREKFLEYAWDWKDEYAGIIRNQWGNLGLALDYSKETFTLDEDVSLAVKKVFVELYNKGLIYQGLRITNWDPKAQTALSDIEVIHKEVEGKFYHFKYMLEDGSDFVEVATTRPETCFGDVALAIHPDDERTDVLVGKKVVVPGTDRLIPIIVDDYVEKDFGSGIVKITPAHDPNDYMVGKRHDLDMPIAMNLDGSMNELALEFSGMDRFECRVAYVNKLKDLDLVVEVKEHIHNVGHSERTGVVVEPILSNQWYVKMQPLADQILEFQKSDDKVEFYPERFENTFSGWMENIQDWCISRQLWWGHRIPVWYHIETGEMYVGIEEPKDIENYRQDEDVLDTWFSSALWPFVTTLWSGDDADLSKFYPTSTLVTGYDIIFFWVARMMFQSYEFTDTKPFNDVLIHGLIRGEDGRKMSKSLGNGIDPIDVIESHGADALRFFLTTNSAPGLDLRYSSEKLDSSWNFINKVWNISRYVLGNTSEIEDISLEPHLAYFDSADKFIISRLDKTISHVNTMMDKYEFGEVGRSLTSLIWDDFASWYVEVSKVSLSSDDANVVLKTKTVLKYVNIAIIKMLHPFMPFVTDEIYTQIEDVKSVLLTSWPEVSNLEIGDEKQFTSIMEMIVAIRNMRQENDIKPSLPLRISVETKIDFDNTDLLILQKIGRLESIELNSDITEDVISIVIEGATVHVATDGAIDNEAKISKLVIDSDKLVNEMKRSLQMLSNTNFMDRAPKEKKEQECSKALNYVSQYEEIIDILNSLGAAIDVDGSVDVLNKLIEDING